MSASPMARQATESKSIPTKRIFINDSSELPSHYSSTPGGTLYSTTPGGTKIVYERNLLMNLRNSPIAKTPPRFDIPDALLRGKGSPTNKTFSNNYNKSKVNNTHKKINESSEDQFQIEL